jgi:hypothetical protein
MVKILVKKFDKNIKLPTYKTSGSSGMDLVAYIKNKIIIKIGKNKISFVLFFLIIFNIKIIRKNKTKLILFFPILIIILFLIYATRSIPEDPEVL